jgi:ubiquitin-protein ligase
VKKSDEHGNVCMPLLTAEGWGPTMTVRTMVTELRKMMSMP